MMTLCNVLGCDQPHYAKGKCNRHYQQVTGRTKGQARRPYRSGVGTKMTAFAALLPPDEAAEVARAAAALRMSRSEFVRAVSVGEARLIAKQANGIDRRALTLRRWRKLYGEEDISRIDIKAWQ